jgi:carbon monoxide dehydrogenase subunit G
MEMIGERRIPAPRQKVWAALNDPAVLKASIPGCESLEKTADNEMRATAAVKIGPISARFNGKVQLTELNPPTSYTISGEGQGGVAGFAKGGADVKLADDGEFTLLTYAVRAQVGGKIAQLGARLIDASAKQMADNFFDRFTAEVAAPAEVGAEGLAGVIAVAANPGGTLSEPAAASPAATAPLRPPVAPAQISIFSMIPTKPFGYPLVFWIGSFICFLIFVLIFSAYL